MYNKPHIFHKFQKIVSKNIFCRYSNNFEKHKVEKPMSQIPYILAAIDEEYCISYT